jgi:hypothetical protein
MKKNTEKVIQAALVDWIKKNYPMLRVSMSANENNHFHMNMGIDAGEPDLWIYAKVENLAHFLRLELKTKTGSLNDNQIAWNEWFDKEYGNCANHKRAVAYGFAEAREIIENWTTNINLTPAPQGLTNGE